MNNHYEYYFKNASHIECSDVIEAFIDRFGLKCTLGLIATICLDKKDHIVANYDEGIASNQWQHNSEIIEDCSNKID